MNLHMNKKILCLLCGAVTACSQADSTVDVQVGAIEHQSAGSHIHSEINLGSAVSNNASRINLIVKVGDVISSAQGSGNRSKINIGSTQRNHAKGFNSHVVIGGKVVLQTNGNDGEINIGSELSD